MSVKVMSWVWDNSTARGIDRLVLLAIADSAEDDGRNAWPSIETLSRKASVDIRTVQRSIRRLTVTGEVRVAKNAGKNGVNVYHVTMTPAERHPGSLPPRQSATPAESRQRGGTAPPPPRHSATQSVQEPSITRPTHTDARGTRLPPDWQPTPELVKYVRENCPDVDGRKATEDFRDYWHAKAGKDAIKVDWPATFRRWMRTEQERAPQARRSPGRPTTDDRVRGHLALAQQLAAREGATDRREIAR